MATYASFRSVMPAAAHPDDAACPPWADLPLDLLRDISHRLPTATEYIRFHAACTSWHDALPPPPCRPAFLPWLLSPPDSSNRRRARCVFSSKSSRRAAAATEVWVRDRRWIVSPEDGTAASTLTTTCPPGSSGLAGGEVDLLTGSAGAAPLPRLQSDDETKWWEDHAIGMVSGDGTISMYLFGPINRSYYLPNLNAAVLRPGDAAWTVVRKDMRYFSPSTDGRYCVAYHDRKIVIVSNRLDSWCISTAGDRPSWLIDIPEPPRCWRSSKSVQSSYLLESGSELLRAFVLVNDVHRHMYSNVHRHMYSNRDLDPEDHSLDSFVNGLCVLVYVLQGVEGTKPQWVKKDDRSLVDRIMFLGKPTSFAVDATRFGARGSGCTYFVVKSQLYGGIWSKSALERCRVFRYNFHNGKSELVEQLPPEWSEEACMWLTPQPSIASIEEIREKLEPSRRKSAEPQFRPIFRIYVGNLPRKVDSHQLRQFFGKHGKVADARIMYHIKTKSSRGFGFVTMATTIDDEPAHAIAKLDGQILDGRPLRVKFADQKQR